MASAVEDKHLDRRFARSILEVSRQYGFQGLVFGFVFSTGLLSMWLSNTATAALMTPLSKAVFEELSRSTPHSDLGAAAAACDLAIAYAATLGGMATITGTGANLVLEGTMTAIFGDAGSISFLNWMFYATPLAILNLGLLWAILVVLVLGSRCSFCCASEHSANISRAGEIEMGFESASSAHTAACLNASSHHSNDPVTTSMDTDEVSSPTHSMPRGNDYEPMAIGNLPHESIPKMGEMPLHSKPWEVGEAIVVLVFAGMILLWITRDPPGGWGWSRSFAAPGMISDGTVAVFCCLVLFVVPDSKERCSDVAARLCRATSSSEAQNYSTLQVDGKDVDDITPRNVAPDGSEADGKHNSPVSAQRKSRVDFVGGILSWNAVQKINWDVVFLLGGGFALSNGFLESGLSQWIANVMTMNGPAGLSSLAAVATVVACILTNVMSNVAVANILLTSLACVAPNRGKSPLVILAPVALASSLALLFPIGTPPNAIVLLNGRVSLRLMAKVGFLSTLIFIPIIVLWSSFVMPHVLPLGLTSAIEVACANKNAP